MDYVEGSRDVVWWSHDILYYQSGTCPPLFVHRQQASVPSLRSRLINVVWSSAAHLSTKTRN